MKKQLTKRDIILSVTIMLVAILLYILSLVQGVGSRVVVTVDGNYFGSYLLSENRKVQINQTNQLEIKDNVVRMIQAKCPDQICVNHMPIKKTGESIICLPNRVIVTIEGEEKGGLDAVVR